MAAGDAIGSQLATAAYVLGARTRFCFGSSGVVTSANEAATVSSFGD